MSPFLNETRGINRSCKANVGCDHSSNQMEVIFANTGKIITYNDGEYKIISSGIRADGIPYVELDPGNQELSDRMCAEIRRHGNLTIRIGGIYRLVLGEDEYPIRRW